MFPQILALGAAACFAMSHVLVRKGLPGANVPTGVLVSLLAQMLILWLITAVRVPWEQFLQWPVLIFAGAGLLVPGVARYFNYGGIQRLGVARSSTVIGASPLFAQVFAVVFLGEHLGGAAVAGTVLIIGGVVCLTRRTGEKEAERTWRGRDFLFPVTAALLYGTSPNMVKWGLSYLNLPVLAAMVQVTTSAVVVSLITTGRGQFGEMAWGRGCVYFSLAGLATVGAFLLHNNALVRGDVVVIAPLVNSVALWTLLFARLLVGRAERITKWMVLGAALVVAGSGVTWLFGNAFRAGARP